MRIGILTFHCAHNYGAVIQCYGLQQYLKSLGHQVVVIDYRPSYFDFYQWTNVSYAKSGNLLAYLRTKISRLLVNSVGKNRYQSFEDFIKYKLNLAPYMSLNDSSDYDAIILGSDQIWSPELTGGNYDDVYFGDNAKCKIISYAASSRTTKLTEAQRTYLKTHLQQIDVISVRETSLNKLLQPLVNKPITTVIDPSILPDAKDYELLCKPVSHDTPYVLIYEINRNADTLRIANEIANSINAEVIELVSYASPKFYSKSIKMESGPIDFLSYIKNAACVVTTSFHGMALSLKFQKNFYSIRQGTNADLRAESLLSKIGLLDRFIPMNSSVEYSEINYSECLPKLNKEIDSSKEFLLKALAYES